jgi:hypothetical protein
MSLSVPTNYMLIHKESSETLCETSFAAESSMPTIGDVMELGGVGCCVGDRSHYVKTAK